MPKYLKAISEFAERNLGADFAVMHEIQSHLVHLDVLIIKPTQSRPFYTLLTSGMSELPMNTPKDSKHLALAEACICLPPEWPLQLESTAWKEPQWFWPIVILKINALFPHREKTWLGVGQSIENPPSCDPEGKFSGVVILPPQKLPEHLQQIHVGWRKNIQLLHFYPVFAEEMTFKLNHGSQKLFEKFEQNGVNEVLDPARRSVCSVN